VAQEVAGRVSATWLGVMNRCTGARPGEGRHGPTLAARGGRVWRRMRVATTAPRAGHRRGHLAPSSRCCGKRRRERRGQRMGREVS
jgi:hypothetical protein